MEDLNKKILNENLQSLEKSLFWLRRSYNQSKNINLDKDFEENDFDILENLTSRFSRTIDLIISKVFRSVDAVEFEDSGTLIDVVNRAEKRRFITSAAKLRELKDLRNEIVHEYETEALCDTFDRVRENVPLLFGIADNVFKYCNERKFVKK